MADTELRCRYVNAAGLRWLGRTDLSQVLGRPGDELLEPDVCQVALPRRHATARRRPGAARQRARRDGCARLGGDEFAVVLPAADPAAVAEIAARITALGCGGVGIGTAAWTPDEELDDRLGAADHAMYQAKTGAHC